MKLHNGGDKNLSCCLHPNKLVVGVCSLCLKEKLLIVASKQEYNQYSSFRLQKKKISTVARKIPKFLKPSSFPSFFDLHRPKQDDNSSSSQNSSILSLQDSFLSLKLDGRKGMVEHGKELKMLRWRKLIRHVFKLAQWSWPSKKGRKCHVGVGADG
ncbi:hypothetical protein KFK09_001126 [Dendrobium nobile]|uniref:Uncharacterized protein n=1 Tax=Dendrobium nobile TaxID=94219 RepID=A0A8T3C7D0_DENNO|nr:hypothetical protein KFK09_001126 [Dendrobium nobile]